MRFISYNHIPCIIEFLIILALIRYRFNEIPCHEGESVILPPLVFIPLDDRLGEVGVADNFFLYRIVYIVNLSVVEEFAVFSIFSYFYANTPGN